MYIHIGGEVILPANQVVGIFPYQKKGLSKHTEAFLKDRDNKKTSTIISKDTVKSIIVTEETVYYSPVSSQTLYKRSIGRAHEDLLDDLDE
ncbi:OrfX protein [Bacillus sp. JCM 19046]|uniref:DUF370 domain-containing protein n=1 Tax=Shouchella xiaoxiensis TaxID=766895 RepID=A0ABS2T3E9_9BACI|nr:extracellular matrix/biofilm biosynthesis regulator RemA family protein [Shouchella xiaoxiensis]MBM7840987.1 hypothetical protein [Shouchella xiaoxiensis]GAF13088.1 OrfX protein [Bacillus sp. JCM 19045]GAF16270.1 OrfX protein [Bacillus sp. JCM 19046]